MPTIISLGGSMIVPDKVDVDFLQSFKEVIMEHDNKFIIVCGGGKTARQYMDYATELGVEEKEDLDWIGIIATRINAELVRSFFGNDAYEKVVYDPSEKIKTEKKIIIAAGYQPGWSTDTDAVILAKNFNADSVINVTNVDYVYDKDPRKHKDAKRLEKVSWDEMKKIVGDKWSPGLNKPFDPMATKKAAELGLKVFICNGLDNLKKILNKEEFKGTIIG